VQVTKNIKDIMVGVFDYPHVPYWFSISQAIKIIRVSLISTKKYPVPIAILVFDEQYNLMGTVTLKDILKGLEPRFLNPPQDAPFLAEEKETELSLVWDALFTRKSKELAEKEMGDIMRPARIFVEPDDPVTKAAYLMLHHGLVILPVLENKRKLIGLVRMVEVFDEISNAVLNEEAAT
jgi:CBS-domain-containing membrane protein